MAQSTEESPHTSDKSTPKRLGDFHKVALKSLAKLGVTGADLRKKQGIWSKCNENASRAEHIVGMLGLLSEKGAESRSHEQDAEQQVDAGRYQDA